MNRTSAASVALASFVVTPLLAQGPAARPPSAPPRIVHIGEGHPYSQVNAINNRRQVVGVMNFPDDEGAFMPTSGTTASCATSLLMAVAAMRPTSTTVVRSSGSPTSATASARPSCGRTDA